MSKRPQHIAACPLRIGRTPGSPSWCKCFCLLPAEPYEALIAELVSALIRGYGNRADRHGLCDRHGKPECETCATVWALIAKAEA